MSDIGLGGLRDFMLRRYEDLKRRLTLQLGNADLAGDALQDTWVRLEGGAETSGPVQYPLSYLMRMATNAALDRLRSESRFLNGTEVEQVFESLSDPAPGPAQTAEARSEAQRLAAVIDEMPPRRRHILILIRVDEMPRQEVARRLGVSVSLVDRELRRAHDHVVERMR
ncbi:RNA polymerase RpoE-like sigma-24 subunit [Variovorax sp. 54]|uniref:RNA polymerase sigma factor n=1 Tax=Variovorax sp. 54 TaxID=2035212 RepID=UPI000C18A97B|nr:RNA polymerase sigma factor [Variovorax sp. 54]PIF77649.1 RNA polymerase RpoE-like sigma-24 subunit [Variovorax sp. 54]